MNACVPDSYRTEHPYSWTAIFGVFDVRKTQELHKRRDGYTCMHPDMVGGAQSLVAFRADAVHLHLLLLELPLRLFLMPDLGDLLL